jgi:hypothetical protein
MVSTLPVVRSRDQADELSGFHRDIGRRDRFGFVDEVPVLAVNSCTSFALFTLQCLESLESIHLTDYPKPIRRSRTASTSSWRKLR